MSIDKQEILKKINNIDQYQKQMPEYIVNILKKIKRNDARLEIIWSNNKQMDKNDHNLPLIKTLLGYHLEKAICLEARALKACKHFNQKNKDTKLITKIEKLCEKIEKSSYLINLIEEIKLSNENNWEDLNNFILNCCKYGRAISSIEEIDYYKKINQWRKDLEPLIESPKVFYKPIADDYFKHVRLSPEF